MIKVREEPREVRRSGLPERLRYLLTDNPVKARDADDVSVGTYSGTTAATEAGIMQSLPQSRMERMMRCSSGFFV